MKGKVMGHELINMPNDEIVIYQPDDTTRLSVRFDGETVWLSQEQMIDLFQRDRSVISRHIANAFKEGERIVCIFCKQMPKGVPRSFTTLKSSLPSAIV